MVVIFNVTCYYKFMDKNQIISTTLLIIACGFIGYAVISSLTTDTLQNQSQTQNINLDQLDQQFTVDPQSQNLAQDKTSQLNDNQKMQIKQLPKPKVEIDTDSLYYAVLDTTQGKIKIELNAKLTPVTANNFVYLAQNKFYDDTIFHRTINGFMIQGGDPTGTGAGGPGYKFDDEPFTGEYTRGVVAMANSGKNTNGSQFFIMHGDTPLQKDYVIFGKVIEGMDVVDKIATAPTLMSQMGEQSKPVNPVKILSVEIITEKVNAKDESTTESKNDSLQDQSESTDKTE